MENFRSFLDKIFAFLYKIFFWIFRPIFWFSFFEFFQGISYQKNCPNFIIFAFYSATTFEGFEISVFSNFSRTSCPKIPKISNFSGFFTDFPRIFRDHLHRRHPPAPGPCPQESRLQKAPAETDQRPTTTAAAEASACKNFGNFFRIFPLIRPPNFWPSFTIFFCHFGPILQQISPQISHFFCA